ncbi:rho GTPase-activating protein 39 isoform X2 [Lingula anatina]|uniref:Rho GTPase-activating protein 39 n=1 Tax=Lingula anatina TaxID=7574 RepID=A0A1S3JEZ1_LINAN|nr:rho GTPase-activating protein 39 isoform X2 [Lingula anatina]|eukprot:XP_013408982.1 rho GTPase-activating protein 39 isoform X2 [Lingula anatina]
MAERWEWVEIIEPRTKEHMYANLTTGECVWDPPPGVKIKKTDDNQWWELFDQNTSRFYYYNATTQKTVWHRPQNCDIIPLAKLQTLKQNTEVRDDLDDKKPAKREIATQTPSTPKRDRILPDHVRSGSVRSTHSQASPRVSRKHHPSRHGSGGSGRFDRVDQFVNGDRLGHRRGSQTSQSSIPYVRRDSMDAPQRTLESPLPRRSRDSPRGSVDSHSVTASPAPSRHEFMRSSVERMPLSRQDSGRGSYETTSPGRQEQQDSFNKEDSFTREDLDSREVGSELGSPSKDKPKARAFPRTNPAYVPSQRRDGQLSYKRINLEQHPLVGGGIAPKDIYSQQVFENDEQRIQRYLETYSPQVQIVQTTTQTSLDSSGEFRDGNLGYKLNRSDSGDSRSGLGYRIDRSDSERSGLRHDRSDSDNRSGSIKDKSDSDSRSGYKMDRSDSDSRRGSKKEKRSDAERKVGYYRHDRSDSDLSHSSQRDRKLERADSQSSQTSLKQRDQSDSHSSQGSLRNVHDSHSSHGSLRNANEYVYDHQLQNHIQDQQQQSGVHLHSIQDRVHVLEPPQILQHKKQQQLESSSSSRSQPSYVQPVWAYQPGAPIMWRAGPIPTGARQSPQHLQQENAAAIHYQQDVQRHHQLQKQQEEVSQQQEDQEQSEIEISTSSSSPWMQRQLSSDPEYAEYANLPPMQIMPDPKELLLLQQIGLDQGEDDEEEEREERNGDQVSELQGHSGSPPDYGSKQGTPGSERSLGSQGSSYNSSSGIVDPAHYEDSDASSVFSESSPKQRLRTVGPPQLPMETQHASLKRKKLVEKQEASPMPPVLEKSLSLQAELAQQRPQSMVVASQSEANVADPTGSLQRQGKSCTIPSSKSGGVGSKKPNSESDIETYAQKHLNKHKKGLFGKKMPLSNLLSWSKDPIQKPMLRTNDKVVKREAMDVFKLIQSYMGDKKGKGCSQAQIALEITTKGWSIISLRDEIYMQLCRQTTDNRREDSLQLGWELIATCLSFFPPSAKFHNYLESYIKKHLACDTSCMGIPISHFAGICNRRLERISKSGAKKGLRKPTIDEIEQAKKSIFHPSMFGDTLDDIMLMQKDRYPNRKLPWIQTTLSEEVLRLNGAQVEGIFRVPGDIDAVNELKVRFDQWIPPGEISDPHVPASLLKLWYRELHEPVIPPEFYEDCINNYANPEEAVALVHNLPEINRLVLSYLIRFLQVFAASENAQITKMDVNNLAMVMAPNCLRCESEDPRVIFENTRKEMAFVRTLIQNLDTSFMEGII